MYSEKNKRYSSLNFLPIVNLFIDISFSIRNLPRANLTSLLRTFRRIISSQVSSYHVSESTLNPVDRKIVVHYISEGCESVIPRRWFPELLVSMV
jgi:hypothetical protein